MDDAFLKLLIQAADKEKIAVTAVDSSSQVTKLQFKNALDQFKKDYTVDEDLLKKLLNSAKKSKDSSVVSEFEKSKPLIKLQLKALIARDLWGMNEFYQIMDVENESLLKAVEILQTSGTYEKILK